MSIFTKIVQCISKHDLPNLGIVFRLQSLSTYINKIHLYILFFRVVSPHIINKESLSFSQKYYRVNAEFHPTTVAHTRCNVFYAYLKPMLLLRELDVSKRYYFFPEMFLKKWNRLV